MVKDENYITIQGWMRNALNLKGNELLVYAMIYGFSQDGETKFTGSVGYIAEWIGSSKQTVFNVLKSLIEKGIIEKEESILNGVKFCRYKAILPHIKNFDGVVKKFDVGSQKILPNNIDNKDNHNIEYIVGYLNERACTHYRPTSKDTKKHIKARLDDGFTVDDFKTVIDKKVAQWKGTQMEEYLRPQTLFGSKFESYLNQNIVKEEKPVKTADKPPEPPRYKQFTPDKEVDAIPMPDEVRKKMVNYEKKFGL